MGKKSARSKGYRVYQKKEKVEGFSDKDLKWMVVGFAALIVIVLLALIVPDIVESSHMWGRKDNWLVTNISETANKKYRKVAEVEPTEGYVLDHTDYLSDENIKIFYFDPESGDAPSYYAYVASKNYDEMCESAMNAMAGYSHVISTTDAVSETVAGRNAAWFGICFSSDITSDSEGNPVDPIGTDEDGNAIYPQRYGQNVNMYIESSVKDRSVMLSISIDGEDESIFRDENELVDILRKAAESVKF